MLQGLIDSILEISAIFVTPDWGALVGMIPLGLLGLVLLWFALTIRRFATAGPARRVPARVTPVTPEGIHMPGPSLAPFLVAFGAAALVWGLVVGGTALLIGAGVLVLTLLAWGLEALRDYDALAQREPLPVVEHAGPPPGVHVPGPSVRPFVVAVGTTFLMYGLVIGGWPLLVGIVFLFWALAGWLVDARAEYVKTVEADRTGHLENIAPRRIPTGAMGVLAIAFVLVALVQVGVLPPKIGPSGGAEGSPAPSTGTLPAGTLAVTAKDIAWDVKSLEVPAGKPFSIKFTNADPAGVPHNIDIRQADGKTVIQTEPNIDGGQTVVYDFKALEPGSYTFVCQVHPIPAMIGTITAK